MRVDRANPLPARRLFASACAVLAALVAASASAFARDSYVQDGASLFSQSTVAALNAKIGDFNSQTGKEIVIVTVPSLDGSTLQAAAEKVFAQQQVNGVLFYFAKAEQQDLVVGDQASRAFFPSGTFANVHTAMRGYLRDGDFDTGITTGVNLVIDQYRGRQNTLPATQGRTAPVTQTTSVQSTGGSHLSFIWLLIILLAGFLIIRAVFRAMSGPRNMQYPPGQAPGPMAGGPGYAPGPGYGYGGGGGGSFFSGLLGGLGGAFLGNELFGNRGGGQNFMQSPTDTSSMGGGGNAPDSSGWQSDPGQADMGNAGGGDWSSGGGFDAGSGGGFDGGGGGGFDGGGGGDSGGGW